MASIARPPRQSTRPDHHLARSKSTSNSASTSSTGIPTLPASKKKQPTPGYVDIIDKLDLSGMDLSFHHSGPFDAARSKGKTRFDRHDPIAAFSSNALDPNRLAVASNGADLAPLVNSKGLSARAKATIAAMDGGYVYGDETYGDQSTENLLSSATSQRRNSDSSITLGFPVKNQDGSTLKEMDRQYLEAFGVHGEAYEDFGRSSYAKKAPRASVYPGERKTTLGGSGLSKESRADRTASIWDIEATLREGRPVGATAAPPPMPIIPAEFMNMSTTSLSKSTSSVPTGEKSLSPSSDPAVKRSKSFMSRMRKKDRSVPSSPDPSTSSPLLSKIATTSPPQASASNGALNGLPSLSYEKASTRPLQRLADRRLANTGNINVQRGLEVRNIDTKGGHSPNSSHSNGSNKAPLPSPLGLPEPVSFNGSSKYYPQYTPTDDDAYYESATAAVLAESSSKESGMSGSSLSNEDSRQFSFASKTATPDTSFGYADTSNYADENKKPESMLPPVPSPEGKERQLNRKPSLAKRLLGGSRKKRLS